MTYLTESNACPGDELMIRMIFGGRTDGSHPNDLSSSCSAPAKRMTTVTLNFATISQCTSRKLIVLISSLHLVSARIASRILVGSIY